MHKESSGFREYNQLIHPTRVAFMKSKGINYFMTETDKKSILSFLIIWTAASIKMTERVENWIKRAGEKCVDLNFAEVGNKLQYHAKQEADHDKMLVNDIKFLIEKWNHEYNDTLTLPIVLDLCNITESQLYIALHEDVINGNHPYTQSAIEYEIERISIVYGPRILENILNTLGQNYADGISFLAEHVLLDQGHTKFNIDLLEKCISNNGNITELFASGDKALNIYSGFLTKCIDLSLRLLERSSWQSSLTV